MKMKRIQSPSSINTYLQCPRKYFYIYQVNLPTSPSIHLLRGSITHKVLEHFFKIDPQTVYRNYELNLKIVILELLKKFWHESQGEFQKLNMGQQEIDSYYEETKEMLINWVSQLNQKINNLNERGFSFTEAFKRLTPKTEVEYINEELSIKGYIDAIEELDGEIRLMDYKTSKKCEISDVYRNQLALYALLYEQEHGRRPHKVGIYFLKGREKLLDVSDDLIMHARFLVEQIHMSTDGMDHISDYPKKESPLCKWHSGQCDFYEYCFYNKKLKKE